jgi:DNA-directed RNA polymerase subunit RPC12/RpoP
MSDWREERDEVTGRRLIRRGVSLLLVWFVVGCATLFLWRDYPWVPILEFVLLSAAMLGLHLRFTANYHCPHCGRRLSRYAERPELETEVRFLCRDCSVMWLTGVAVNND